MTIPVTILGGYLGSGKTTLINAALADLRSLRLAVIVNDFGAVNIDADALGVGDGDILELSNGCVCCSLGDGMATAMDRIAGMEPAPDYVLIEVSGVGDPGVVAEWGGLPGFGLHRIIVCADAETVRAKAADRWVADTVRRQLQSADTVFLTKTDLVDPDRCVVVEAWLKSVAPGAEVVRDIGLAGLIGRESSRAVGPRVAPGDPHTAHVSFSVTTDALVDRDEILATLQRHGDLVVRAKGIVRASDARTRRTVIQIVGSRSEVTDGGPWRDEDHLSTLVLIGDGSGDLSALEADLRRLF